MDKSSCLYYTNPTKEQCLKCDFYVPERIEKYETMPGEFEEETIKEECMAIEIF
jgi:hypothetical protein